MSMDYSLSKVQEQTFKINNMANTAKRIIVSETTKRTATLDAADFRLTFTYEGEAGKAVQNVQVNGTKGNGYINYNKNGQQTTFTFNNLEYDQSVIDAINAEVADIVKPI